MNQVKNKSMLDLFHTFPENMTTSRIIEILYPNEYQEIENGLLSSDRKIVSRYRSRKQMLRRKILYHLNELERRGIIHMTSLSKNGEKRFSLKMKARKPNFTYSPHLRYSQFSRKIDSIAIEFDGTRRFARNLRKCLSHSSGSLCISADGLDVDKIVKHLPPGNEVDICLNLRWSKSLPNSIHKVPSAVNIVVGVDRKDLASEDFIGFLDICRDNCRKVSIKINDENSYFVFNDAVYPIGDGRDISIASLSNFSIDFEELLTANNFEIKPIIDSITNMVKPIIETNIQQRVTTQLFLDDIDSDGIHSPESKNHIILENYSKLQNKDHCLNILNSLNRRISDFCKAEETIYRASGMPIDFKIVLLAKNNSSLIADDSIAESRDFKRMLRDESLFSEAFNGNYKIGIINNCSNSENLVHVIDEIFTRTKIPIVEINNRSRSKNLKHFA